MKKFRTNLLPFTLLVSGFFSSLAWSSSVMLDDISAIAKLIYDSEPQIEATSDVKQIKNNQSLTYRITKEEAESDLWSIVIIDGQSDEMADGGQKLLTNIDNMNFHRELDGSLLIKISKHRPGDVNATNWLKAPEGSFYLVKYVYL
ncbi:DUF1214 domain-containing protein [Vibrio crassostreae]|uniref:DUF1214 domain-containing protein n=1 Tax=Vibrio crassostreae TaxID=246167 RepID=A0A822MP29_9VIBR|nr:DUF1214 domain-containing protein [Vibrio crassostreae]MDH5952481.1 DUF1214 domain-containing protein [Vibrio crassostreae]ROS70638.1 uncharacterized protein DUF1214 [Vibrio crassostreae]TCL30480.1 uncharacterized protein DUF1214 [Vibrio crassostreae]TCN09292.1 uncharacterized protein DUF1214 [Vibrio crassostreae]TCT53433.1 uncharacterized protein DUF1214 [Vibrio crassostreae]